ncbi:MAG: hypothetical protein A3B66_06475 [Alphaproteobacteria bacterium RIFCSPHIGHO2_02_FULL_46_13]|nr:MAG: hypothetical protein A3B66_06475 [Alphaproteobacteria bacterium RIFCSPHIGHO2_02_FULL_46_13]
MRPVDEMGKPTTASDPDAIWEPFLDGTEPDSNYASPTGNDSGDGVYQPPAVSDKLPAEDMLTPNPDDSSMVQVNARTGKPTTASDPDAIWEPFLDGTEPDSNYASPTGNDSGDGVYQPPAVSDKLPAEDMLTPNPDDSSPSSLEGTGGVY